VSAENVQIIRRLVEAFNDRDLDAMATHMQPGAELYPLRAQLEGKAYRGHDGLREMLADFDQDWEFVRMDADEFRDAGDQVVVLGRLRARGRISRVDLDVPMGFVWRLRDGKVVYARSFSEPDDALRAAGLG
jgi:ketosteroid isomerase-like protein